VSGTALSKAVIVSIRRAVSCGVAGGVGEVIGRALRTAGLLR
jgi:hypothetical protein